LTLASALDLALALTLASDLTLASALDRARASNLASASASTLALALASAITRDRDRTSNLNLAIDSELSLDRVSNTTRAIDSDLTSVSDRSRTIQLTKGNEDSSAQIKQATFLRLRIRLSTLALAFVLKAWLWNKGSSQTWSARLFNRKKSQSQEEDFVKQVY